MSEDNNTYSYELEVKKQMFYNENDLWGAYSFRFTSEEEQRESGVNVHPMYKNFVISGNTFKLTEGERYTVHFEDSYSAKYGQGYAFVEVENEGLKTRASQEEFLHAVLHPNIATAICEAFPNTDTLLKDIVSGKINLKTVQGIGDKTELKYLDKIKQFEKYQDAIVFLAPLGAGIGAITKLVDYFGGSEQLKQIIDSNIYRLTEVSGFGFKRVDEFALKLGYDPESEFRVQAGAVYTLEQMSDYGSIKIPVKEFDDKMCSLLEISEVGDETFTKILNSEFIYYADGHIALVALRDEEKAIAERIARIDRTPSVELSNNEEGGTLVELAEKVIKETEEKNGFKFHERQVEAIMGSLEHGITIINGKGGTGKTAVVKTIVDIFQRAGHSYGAMALSGKAANVMVENGMENSGTMHRQLAWSMVDYRFMFDAGNPMGYDLVILDEASMVNNTLFLCMLEAVRDEGKLIIVGDSGQLPAIGHGAAFDKMLKNKNIFKVELTKVHRQAQKSGILSIANKVREGTQITSKGQTGTTIHGELKDMFLFSYNDKTAILDDVIKMVERFRDNPNTKNSDLQLLSPRKKGDIGVEKLNLVVQDIMNPKRSEGQEIKVQGKTFRVGDRVIQNGNFYKAVEFESESDFHYLLQVGETFPMEGENSVYNGSIGYIVALHKDDNQQIMLVRFEDFSGVRYVPYINKVAEQQMGMLDLGYVLSVHRSQGSGFNTVFLVLDYSSFMLLSRELVYTGITRAIKTCFLFAENAALKHGIKTSHNNKIKSYLGEFLTQEYKKEFVPVEKKEPTTLQLSDEDFASFVDYYDR